MKSNKQIVLSIITSFLTFLQIVSYGQQLPTFTQQSEYAGLLNPAHIGFDTYHNNAKTNIAIAYRDQWVSIPDRPRTFVVKGEHYKPNSYGVGLMMGGYLVHDEAGIFTNSELRGRIAGTVKLGKKLEEGAFSIGMNTGIVQYRTNLTNFAYIENDPLLFQENASVIYPDVGVGVSFFKKINSSYLQLGFSVPQVFNLNTAFRNENKEFNITRNPHYYFTAQYYKLFNSGKYLEFSSWVKKVKYVPVNYDVMVRYRFAHNMWLGTGVNNSGIIHVEWGLSFLTADEKRYQINYSYNPTFNAQTIIFGATHEIGVSIYAF